ncbi:hypothetical protein AB8B21_05555 [Tardiphaga sp. 866_E4_N2_1]|uniref:hypothetical protein n=1 Tax=unclassified Tardiphaga TaxID=2631404 RepID=UPI003F1FBBFD
MGLKANLGASLMMACMAVATADQANAASADKRSFPAKGTKTCRITQYSSKYQSEKGNPSTRTLPRPSVNKNGSVDMGFAEDLYPGTKLYFLIDGRRYVGPAGYKVGLDKRAVEALKKDPVVQYTFTRWPYRNELNGADVIEGFDAAYQDCLQFMKSGA